MNKLQKWIWVNLIFGILIYLLSPGIMHLISNPTLWEMQAQFMYFTGICSMTLMVTSMLLSLRIPKLNSIFGGLDKSYVIHKWTGIFTTVFVVTHWLGDKIPLLMVKLHIASDPNQLIDINQFTKLEIGLYKSGLILAEVLFYVFIFLIVISLYKKISYHFFRKTHRYIPLIFLIYAYHGATAPLKEQWYGDPRSYIVLVIIGIGCFAALTSLFGQIGQPRKTNAVIKSVERHGNGILDIHLETIDKTIFHQPGQYAYLQFKHNNEPHPFTIACSAKNPNNLRFVIKELGDFTNELKNSINTGQHVKVEGPYGEFKFEDNCDSQIWIAGGIGITPFMAQLHHLSRNDALNNPIHFWYCTKGDLMQQFPGSLQELCDKARVNLYHLNSNKEEFFSVEILKNKFENLEKCSIWYCGPSELKSMIKKELKSIDFNLNNFHYDSFSMR